MNKAIPGSFISISPVPPVAMGLVLLSFALNHAPAVEPVWTHKHPTPGAVTVRSIIPSACPFKASTEIVGLQFTGRYADYTTADTWDPSWASDGNLYSPWTDGNIHGTYAVNTTPECHSSQGYTGMARIEGDDPMDLTVVSLGTYHSPPAPYGGRYPCGSLVHNGVWYYGTYALTGAGWAIAGTFPGFRISTNYGVTWQQTPLNCTPGRGLFPEPEAFGGPVKFVAPHFVDFGRNMEHSPDGKAYLVAHGGTQWEGEDRKGNISWISGDKIYLCRVMPSPQTINDRSQYEFFAGHDAQGNPVWSRDFRQVKPLVEWENHCGSVTITYNAPLKRYLMCVTDGGVWFSTMKAPAWVNPSTESNSPSAPEVLLEEVWVDGRRVYPEASRRQEASESRPDRASAVAHFTDSGSLRVAPGRRSLDFGFVGMNLGSPEKVRYRSKLEGLDPEWSYLDRNRYNAYTGLPSGKLTFLAQASMDNATWSPLGAKLSLTIPPHFWQTWWFIGVLAVCVLALLLALHALRLSR